MSRPRFVLTLAVPTMLLLAWAVLPLVRGGRTLYLRDAMNTHLAFKWVQARAMEQGELPLIHPYRDGGQPFLGNPNTVALYPDNLLYLAADTFWAFNAHFWLHLLLAPWAVFWLGRAWGLGRGGAWAAGVCYAGAGFFLANLNLYNLVAGITWAPALAAALLGLTSEGRRGAVFAAAALLWALLLLGGDPMTAALALAIAVSAAAVRSPLPARAWLAPAGAIALGTLAAAPQIVEFARVLPHTFRGHWGFSAQAATAASWNPLGALEWLVPLAFGPPGPAHWGSALLGGEQPLYFSLYPGLLALALVAAAGRPRGRRAALWAWGLVGAGLFFALGGYNPLVVWLLELPGAGLLRLPVKLWLAVALGASLLCGVGFERFVAGDGRRAFHRALAALAVLLAALWLPLTLLSGRATAVLAGWMGGAASGSADHERLRWAGLCLLSLGLLAAFALVGRLLRARPAAAGALLLAIHLAAQLWLLAPLMATDATELYRRPPRLLEAVPRGSIAVHGGGGDLFGVTPVDPGLYPDARPLWIQRQVFEQLYPAAAALWERRFDLTASPEGLDAFLSRATAQALAGLDDRARIRVLAASGVDRLLLPRPLAAGTGGVRDLGPVATDFGPIHVYALTGSAAPVEFVGRVLRAPHLNAALSMMTDESFDPRTMAVLPGEGPPLSGEGGSVEVLEASAERLRLRVEAASPGALVIQRAFLPVYRVLVDGEPATAVAANLHRIGIELAAGRHEVRVEVARGALAVAAVASLLGLAAIAAVALGWRRRPAL